MTKFKFHGLKESIHEFSRLLQDKYGVETGVIEDNGRNSFVGYIPDDIIDAINEEWRGGWNLRLTFTTCL